MKRPVVEFLDPDGSYALVQPFDEVRGRVLSSNVLPKGHVLHKDEKLSWSEAEEDLGGFTRLGPSDFLPQGEAGPEPAWEGGELTSWLLDPLASSREERILDPLLELESPPPGLGRPEQEVDPVGLLLGLVRHFRKLHLTKEGTSRWVAPCRCPGFQVQGERLRARLHKLARAALLDRKLPSLSRILVALRETFGRRVDAA